MQPTKPTILIIAGGTGGHVMPALSVATVMQQRGWHVHWLGTRRGIEATVVPKHGFAIDYISVTGLRGKRVLTKLLAPWRILHATIQALCVIRRLRPRVVLGMGGFVTGPGCIAAKLYRVPVVIHEQNAIAGLTNRYLAYVANCVCSGFANAFANCSKAIVTGNPVRDAICALKVPTERYQAREGVIRLLVVGGSLGAKAINDIVPTALASLPVEKRPKVWHQTGKQHIEATRALYQSLGVDGRVEPFIDDMADAYAWADVILCRAGASTVAELAVAGVASVLVPYPYAVDDHQRHNASVLVNMGAAKLYSQCEFSAQTLLQWLQSSSITRQTLLTMALAARKQGLPNAAVTLAEYCIQHGK